MTSVSEALIQETCEQFKVHPRDLMGDYRFKFLMKPRFALAKALRLRGWTYPQIGKALNAHHTSILYRVREADYHITKDPKFAEKVRAIASLEVTNQEGASQC